MLLIARGYPAVWMAREALGIVAAARHLHGGAVPLERRPVPADAAFVQPPASQGSSASSPRGSSCRRCCSAAAPSSCPGISSSAALMAGAGAMYAAVLLERRMIGAGLVAFVLLRPRDLEPDRRRSWCRGSSAPASSRSRSSSSTRCSTRCGALGIHLLVFEDMTYELRATNRRLEMAREELLQAAITDPLTGCHNRRFLDQVDGPRAAAACALQAAALAALHRRRPLQGR